MADIQWIETVEDSTWQVEHNGLKAHIVRSSAGCLWWVDNGCVSDTNPPDTTVAQAREAAGAAVELAEAAVEVIHGYRHELAIAKAVLAVHQADVAVARVRVAEVEARIAKIEEKVLRRVCAVAGTGETRAIALVAGRVSIALNPPRVELEEGFDARLLPETLQRVTIEPDKVAINAALRSGPVLGCFFVQTDRVVCP